MPAGDSDFPDDKPQQHRNERAKEKISLVMPAKFVGCPKFPLQFRRTFYGSFDSTPRATFRMRENAVSSVGFAQVAEHFFQHVVLILGLHPHAGCCKSVERMELAFVDDADPVGKAFRDIQQLR